MIAIDRLGNRVYVEAFDGHYTNSRNNFPVLKVQWSAFKYVAYLPSFVFEAFLLCEI